MLTRQTDKGRMHGAAIDIEKGVDLPFHLNKMVSSLHLKRRPSRSDRCKVTTLPPCDPCAFLSCIFPSNHIYLGICDCLDRSCAMIQKLSVPKRLEPNFALYHPGFSGLIWIILYKTVICFCWSTAKTRALRLVWRTQGISPYEYWVDLRDKYAPYSSNAYSKPISCEHDLVPRTPIVFDCSMVKAMGSVGSLPMCMIRRSY